jgi:HK97 family phage major capsid protein
LTPGQSLDFDTKHDEIRKLIAEIDLSERSDDCNKAEAQKLFDAKCGKSSGGDRYRSYSGDGKEYRSVKHGESFRTAAGIHETSDFSLGRLAMATILGDNRHLNNEERAYYSQGTSTAGGYLLSPVQSAQVIDAMRAKSIMSLAGAQTMPLTSEETKVAFVSADPTAYWTSEGSTIVESEGTFGSLNLRSRALAIYCECSLELLRNASNAESVIENTIIGALAAGLDAACLSGTGAAEQPCGLLNVATNQIIEHAAVGVVTYDTAIIEMAKLWAFNTEPTSWLMSPSLRSWVQRLKDGEGRPQQVPMEVAKLRQLSSSAITSNDVNQTSYIGDFSSAIIGLRSAIEVEFSGVSGEVFKKKKVAIRGLVFGDFNAGAPNRIVRMTGITGC